MKQFARMRKDTLLKQVKKFQLPIPNAEQLSVEKLRSQINLHIKMYLESWFMRRVKEDILLQHDLMPPGRNKTYLPNSKLEFDFSWRSIRLAVEIQGGLERRGGHTTAAGIKRDMRKMCLAQINGWLLLQLHSEEITSNSMWELHTMPLIVKAIQLQRSRSV